MSRGQRVEDEILASELVKILRKSLVGRLIMTNPMGLYPGGIAMVMKIKPDKNCPGIVMNVSNPFWKKGEEIGVFGHEYVKLLPLEEQ